jgi:hypothetical protein
MRTAARKGMMVSNRMWYLRCGRKLVCERGTQDPPLHETKAQEWGTQNRQRGEKSDMARHGLFGLASPARRRERSNKAETIQHSCGNPNPEKFASNDGEPATREEPSDPNRGDSNRGPRKKVTVVERRKERDAESPVSHSIQQTVAGGRQKEVCPH